MAGDTVKREAVKRMKNHPHPNPVPEYRERGKEEQRERGKTATQASPLLCWLSSAGRGLIGYLIMVVPFDAFRVVHCQRWIYRFMTDGIRG